MSTPRDIVGRSGQAAAVRQVDFERRGIATAYDAQVDDQWVAHVVRAVPATIQRVELALEIGCGPAQHSRALLRGFPEAAVIGLELSREMISAAGQMTCEPCLSLVRGDALACPIRRSAVDLVLMRYLVHHVTDIATLFAQTYQSLRQPGVLIVETTDPDFLREWNADLYGEFPRIAEFDLGRWPPVSDLTSAAIGAGFAEAMVVPIQVDKGWRDLRQTIESNRERARTGIGSSFWQLLTEEERLSFCEWEIARLKRLSVDGKVPHIWHSSLLVLLT